MSCGRAVKKLSLSTATAPGNLEEVECGRLGLLHTAVGNLGVLWEMGSFEQGMVLPTLCAAWEGDSVCTLCHASFCVIIK